jgi:hypothetical protein
VGIAQSYRDGLLAGRHMFNSRQCKIFLFSIASIPKLGPTKPPIEGTLGTLSGGKVKRQRREPVRSPLYSEKVKKGEPIPPLPHMSSEHSG